jgi:uncharacterized membrane protein YoaK (UPF0700 family)
MWLWLPLLAFAVGVIVGRFSVRRYRHDRIVSAPSTPLLLRDQIHG